jgi:hypothetical protein
MNSRGDPFRVLDRVRGGQVFDLVSTRFAREAIEQSSNAVVVSCEGDLRRGSGGKVTVFLEKEN